MTTPLSNPITINLTLETQEDLIGLLLRANLDADNLRTWYHDHRSRPEVNVPDVRMSGLYKALKAHMDEEGFDFTSTTPTAAVIDARMG